MGALRLTRFRATGPRRVVMSPGTAVALKRGYRGDPGFLSFLSSAVSGVENAVKGALPLAAGAIFGPVGGVIGSALSGLGSVKSTTRTPPPPVPGTALTGPVSPRLPAIRGSASGAVGGPGLGGTLSVGGPMGLNVGGGLTLGPGGAGIMSLDTTDDTGGDTAAAQAVAVTCNIKGYHFNKRGYYTKHGFVPAHSKCVKNRRRNALNPRALHHSVSRLLGFQHAAAKVEKSLSKLARRSSAGRSAARAARGRPGHKAGCGCVVCRR